MRLCLGADPNGTLLAEAIKQQLVDLGYELKYYGSHDPIYPNTAIAVGEAIARGDYDRGILICGTGIGMCIAANKVPGVYAALCSDLYSTERSIKSNNANVMTIGAQTIGMQLAIRLVVSWLNTKEIPSDGSQVKIQRIYEYEQQRDGRLCL